MSLWEPYPRPMIEGPTAAFETGHIARHLDEVDPEPVTAWDLDPPQPGWNLEDLCILGGMTVGPVGLAGLVWVGTSGGYALFVLVTVVAAEASYLASKLADR